MKKIIIPIISTILLLSIFAATIFAFNLQEKNDANISTLDKLTTIAVSENGTFSVSEFNQREIFTDFSQENLNQIFASFDVVLAKNDKIELDGGSFVKDVLRNTEYTEKDGKIIVSTDIDSNKLKYAMFASVFIQNFPDNIRPMYTEEEKRLMNRIIIGNDIIISFDYENFGYKNTDEYIKDKRNTPEIGENTYRLSSTEIDMYAVKGNYYGSPTDNILSMLNPGITGRQESMSKTNNISDLPPEILEQFKDLLTD